MKLVVVLVVLAAVMLIEPSLQCGMTTHNFIGRRALFWANMSRHMGDTAMNAVLDHCLQHQDAFQAGCAFPDWGYNCMGFGDASEAAHWVPFIEQASLYLHARYANSSARSEHDDKFAAFLFGVMSHSVADISWHNLGPVASLINQGMIQQLAVDNFAGDYDQAHSTADVGGEMINSYEQGLPWLRDSWWVPARDLTVVYQQLDLQVELKPLVECNAVLFVGAHAVKTFGDELFEMHVGSISDAPFLMNNLKDYWIGGLDDMATWTSYCWSPIADWIVNGTANISSCLIEPPANAASPLLRQKRNAALRRLAEVVLDQSPDAVSTDVDEATGSAVLRVDADKIEEALARSRLTKDEGASTPLYGCSMRPNVTADEPPSDQQDAVFATNAPYSYLGTATATGDWNGDGIVDIAISAPGFSSPTNGGPNAGRVYVFFAVKGATTATTTTAIIAEDEAGLILDGEEFGARFGSALVTLDYNLDGIDDLCAGASSSGVLGLLYHGRVVCHFGSTTAPLSTRASITGQCASSSECAYQFANLGSSLSAFDVNLDGHPDLVAGIPSATISGVGAQAGGVLAFFSSTQNVALQQDRAIDTADLQIRGTSANSQLGSAVAQLDKATLLVGEPSWTPDPSSPQQPQTGRVLAFSLGGNTSTPLYSIESSLAYAAFGTKLAVGSLAFGGESAVVVAVTALAESTRRGRTQAWQAGEVYLINASSLVGLSGSTPLQGGGVDVLSTLTGESNAAAFGQALSITDVNGDGSDDLVIGQFRRSTAQSQLTDTPIRRDAGALFAFLGGSPSLSFDSLSPFQSSASWCAGFPHERAWFGEHIAVYQPTPSSSPVLLVSARVDSRFAERAGTVEVLDLTSLQ